MRKKILSALLLGLFTVASTSTFVSCKDYDDDISNLQTQINNLESVKAVKTDVESSLASLKTELAAKDAELTTLITNAQTATTENKALINKEIERATAAEAALESKIDACNAVIEKINGLVATNTTSISELKNLYASLEAIQTDLGKKLTENYTELKNGLKDEETARLAVAADLENQKTALEKLTTKVSDLTTLEANDKTELLSKIETLQTQITESASKIATNATDIASLKTSVSDLYDKITAVNNEIAVLNVFISGQLRSLVFKPVTYYWGVEALTATTLKYVYYTPWTAASADVKETTGYSKCERYKNVEGSTAKDLVAHYHMNPSIADTPDSVSVTDDDKIYTTETKYTTRSSASQMYVKTQGWKKNGGDLDVTLRFKNPNSIMSVADNSMITVFATSAHYKTAGKDTVVTSDYAAVYKTTIDKLVLSHTTTAASFTGQVNTCKVDFNNVYDNLHSINNCTLTGKTDLHLIPSVFDAIAIPYQDVCRYDQTLDLDKLVETHFENAGKHAVMTATELKDYGLEYRYELTASFLGGNATSEAAHAGIKGSTFRPQIPQKDGKAYSYDAFTALNESLDSVRAHAVGREPIVRVTLVDTNNGDRVLDYGYIKIKITDKTTVEVAQPNVKISYTGDPIDYKSDCAIKDYTFTTTWNQIEYDILRLTGLHKAEFDAAYDRNGQLVIDGSAEVQQYKPSTINTTTAAVATVLNPYIGTVVDNYDANSPETSTFTWTIPGTYLVKELYGKTSHTPFTIAIRYKSLDQKKNPDIYIVLSTGAISIESPSGVWLKADGSDRIKNYWYKDNGNGADQYGNVEIHAQTLSPEDPNAGSVASVLDDRFSDVFVGNTIALSSVTDCTVNKDFAATKRLYNFVFSSANEGKKFIGCDTLSVSPWGYVENVEWTLGVKDNGKTLYAKAKNGVTCNYNIATIDGTYTDATGIKQQKISYVKNSPAAESLLNYKRHNALADDVLKAIVQLKVKTNVCEHELALTSNEFNVRFLRPINVIGVNAEREDAQDAAQVIDLQDLVKLSDWREYQFADHTSYWKFYNIKAIRVIGNYTFGDVNNQATGIVNPYIYTTMTKVGTNDNKLEDKICQSTISNQVLFRVIKPETAHPYGYLLYENLSSTVQTFTVRVPLEVQYEWGKVFTTVDVTIKNTHENAKRK